MKKEKKKEKTEKVKKVQNNNQIKYLIAGMIVVLVLVFGVYYVFQSMNNFDYAGMKFQKQTFGKIEVYNTKIPITGSSGNVLANYNLYLRNDPRDLGNIILPAELRLQKNVVVSVDPRFESGCSDDGIAGANFFTFMKTAGYQVSLAYTNESYADERNASYAPCVENSTHSTITITEGSEDRVFQEDTDCYVIEVKDCDILKTTERFMAGVLAGFNGVSV